MQITALGSFIVLALVVPGSIIASAFLILFPDATHSFPSTNQSVFEVIGLILLVALITAHIPFLIERYILDHIWSLLFPHLRIIERRNLVGERSETIANAELLGLSHQHYDQTLSEFILFNNTSCWLIVISAVRLLRHHSPAYITPFSWVILLGSAVTLLFACPFFKASYLSIVETLQAEIVKKRDAELRTSIVKRQSRTTRRTQSGH